MAAKFLTMLDLAKRSGSDTSIGLVEEVTTFSPELRVFPARSIAGVTYLATRRTALPQGGFRDVGEGSHPGASTFEQFSAQCFFLDYQLQLDEAKKQADEGKLGDLLAGEASGAMQQMALDVGSQIYYGVSADSKGFAGFNAAVDSSKLIDAGGDGSDTTSAWLVWFNPKGVRLTMGGNMTLGLGFEGEWPRQQVNDPNDATKKYMAYVNNARGWLGLEVNSSYALVRVHSIENAVNKRLTDEVGAAAKALLPSFLHNSGELRWLMNYSQAGLGLQVSRGAVGSVSAGSDGRSAFAPEPTSLAGVPIIWTDSLVNTETAP